MKLEHYGILRRSDPPRYIGEAPMWRVASVVSGEILVTGNAPKNGAANANI